MVGKEPILNGYDTLAGTYLQGRAPSDAEREALASFLDGLPNDARVLDAGCGGGEPVLDRVAGRSHRAVGVDFSTAQLDIAREHVPEAEPLCGDMTRIPVAANSLDGVLAMVIEVPATPRAPTMAAMMAMVENSTANSRNSPENCSGTGFSNTDDN